MEADTEIMYKQAARWFVCVFYWALHPITVIHLNILLRIILHRTPGLAGWKGPLESSSPTPGITEQPQPIRYPSALLRSPLSVPFARCSAPVLPACPHQEGLQAQPTSWKTRMPRITDWWDCCACHC